MCLYCTVPYNFCFYIFTFVCICLLCYGCHFAIDAPESPPNNNKDFFLFLKMKQKSKQFYASSHHDKKNSHFSNLNAVVFNKNQMSTPFVWFSNVGYRENPMTKNFMNTLCSKQCVNVLFSCLFIVIHCLDFDSFPPHCRIFETDQRQNISESNIKTRLSSACLITLNVTKSQCLHLITAQKGECGDITKTGPFSFLCLQSFLRFPLHSESWYLHCPWCDLPLSFCHRPGSINTNSPCPSRLDLT